MARTARPSLNLTQKGFSAARVQFRRARAERGGQAVVGVRAWAVRTCSTAVACCDNREAYGQQILGLTPDTVHEEIPEQVQRVCANVRKAQDIIDRRRGTPEYLGSAWGDLARRERDAILEPPKPDIAPASELVRRAQERQAVSTNPEHA